MNIFTHDHEQVVFFNDPEVSLKAIVAIHSTTLGPAIGGLRMWNYDTTESALEDVLRLSKAMTYKAAVAGLNCGGGKAVIIGNPKKDKSEALFRSFGAWLESLNGRYITAEDVGTDVNDMEYIYMETRNVVGVAKIHGGSGDPSPWTAKGVLSGLQACVEKKLKKESLKGLSVAIQGAGNVGRHLVELCLNAGMKVFVADIDSSKCLPFRNRENVEIVNIDEIYDLDVDIFSPCALGAILNDKTISKLKCKIVAGSANNQLANLRIGDELFKKGILYAPDYAINAGGLINVSMELQGYNENRVERMIHGIYYTMKKIFEDSEKENLPEYKCADRVAEKRIQEIGRIKCRYVGHFRPRFRGKEE